MTFTEWVTSMVENHPKRFRNRPAVYRYVAGVSDVSIQTIYATDRGQKLRLHHKAKALSDATQGAVTIEELCG